MKFNVTEAQRTLLRQVVGLRCEHQIEESFEIKLLGDKACEIYLRGVASNGTPNRAELSEGSETNFVSLINANCLQHVSTAKPPWGGWRAYALTALGMHAVETNFADDPPPPQPSNHTNNFHAAVFGAQFGDNNQQYPVNVAQAINAMIEESAATPAQKTEAKGVVSKFIEHPAITSILGGLVSVLSGQVNK